MFDKCFICGAAKGRRKFTCGIESCVKNWTRYAAEVRDLDRKLDDQSALYGKENPWTKWIGVQSEARIKELRADFRVQDKAPARP